MVLLLTLTFQLSCSYTNVPLQQHLHPLKLKFTQQIKLKEHLILFPFSSPSKSNSMSCPLTLDYLVFTFRVAEEFRRPRGLSIRLATTRRQSPTTSKPAHLDYRPMFISGNYASSFSSKSTYSAILIPMNLRAFCALLYFHQGNPTAFLRLMDNLQEKENEIPDHD